MIGRLLVLLALLLFGWQSFVLQTHGHGSVRSTMTAASARVDAQASPDRHSPDAPPDCPVCRELAHAGPYLSPDGVAVVVPVPITAWLADSAPPVFAHGSSSHHWRSRAPPLTLHA